MGKVKSIAAATLSRMEQDWDRRAREAPEHYIASAHLHWQPDDFFRSGEINVNDYILADSETLFGGRTPDRMRILELGCGAGRMTRALAAVFAEVHAVDISGEMIALARRNLSGLENVLLYKNSGADLAQLPDGVFDFAFSYIVFQHIPSLAVIETYAREVCRCLKPGATFKFQVQGDARAKTSGDDTSGDDTWTGVPISLADARLLATRSGFQMARAAGEGSQNFWLWFRKPRWLAIPVLSQALVGLESALAASRFRWAKPVAVSFSARLVRAGETYEVLIPSLAGDVIDVGYEFAADGLAPVTGVVGKWCKLDSQGKASIPVPADHPAGLVRITRVRSQSRNSRWRPAQGVIQVASIEVSRK